MVNPSKILHDKMDSHKDGKVKVAITSVLHAIFLLADP